MRNRVRTCDLLIASLLGLGLGLVLAGKAIGDNEGLYLFEIEAESRSRMLDTGSTQFATLTVFTDHPAAFSQQLALTSAEVLDTDATSIRVILPKETVFSTPPATRDLAASWVIDFEQTAVKELSRELGDATGNKPTVEQLTAFVSSYISDKNYVNSFNLASQVAKSREGDCTEHAVLTTALARAQGYPARVVLGAAVLLSTGNIQVVGHAWSEIYDGSGWHISDAALFTADDTVTVYYLPWGTMAAEGPNFVLPMYEIIMRKPYKVVLEAL